MRDADYNIRYFDTETQNISRNLAAWVLFSKIMGAFENKSAGVCYIPGSHETQYTPADFMRIAKGNAELAEYLFYSVDSQRPELLFDELICHDVIEEDGTLTQSYQEDFGRLPDIPYWF